MYRVLVAADDDEERAIAQAETLLSLPAAAAEVTAILLHVYEEIDLPADEGGSVHVEELNRSLDELRDPPETVDRLADRLDAAGVAYERREAVGDPAEAVLTAAADVGADAILLGSRKRTPVGKAVFGSVSQDVILGADRPVIVARS
jgi:nucleotide-binding universal stress UspA family protein